LSESPHKVPPALVLVVEDEPVIRLDIVAELKAEGFLVAEAASAEDALALIQDSPVPDVVFTDIQLAGRGTGWDVAEAIRQRNPEAAVIYASGQTIEASRRVAGSAAFSKPYRTQDIVGACCTLMPHKS